MKERAVYLCMNLIALALLSVCAFAAGPRMQVLHSFVGGTDGSMPRAGVIADAVGNLYGTTSAGGSSNSCFGSTGCGVVFELIPPRTVGGTWKEKILYRFSGGPDGAGPATSLTMDQAGNLYGTTPLGGDLTNQLCSINFNNGCGIVFELTPQQDGSWVEKIIYTFEGVTDGAYPWGSLVFDTSGNLFGTTSAGGGGLECNLGELLGCGTVFELSPNGSGGWIETTIYRFQGLSDGGMPFAGLTLDQVGNLYGTTAVGGSSTSSGTVFEISPQQGWTESVLYEFTANAGQPNAGVIFDPQGNLYGVTATGNGTAFELTETGGVWNENTIYSFTGGRFEGLTGGLVRDTVGNLYGPKSGPSCGAIYRLQKANNQWNEVEFVFPEHTTGPCAPVGTLSFGKWGALYGASNKGGTCNGNGCGTVFGILR
jgi:uncharacterized repeat protein (TIGR03803 family)